MNKLYIFFLFLILSNCSVKPVIKHHGTNFLENKSKQLIVRKTNKNDIQKILGTPSTKSKFDNDIWIYIEQKQTQSRVRDLGKMKIIENNVLILEINKYGVLEKKEFYNKDDMEKIKIAKTTTQTAFEKNSFIYNFFTSMREKLNDPLGARAKKRESINQR